MASKKRGNSTPWHLPCLALAVIVGLCLYVGSWKPALDYNKIADEIVVLGDLDGGHGSGVIISADGLILTNGHVAVHANDDRTMQVQFHDGHTAKAHVLWLTGDGSDPYDIALLKVDGEKPLPFARIGTETLKVGQSVFHIGNPIFFGWTVTWGHISAFNRDLTRANSARNLIQDDLSIAPGSSGGALFDAEGNLIGITNAAFPGNMSMSFAVSRDTIRMLLGGGA